MTARRWSLPSPGWWLAFAAAALFFAHAYALRITQDDAYISLQYARNLVEGHGLVFNVGERVEGYSNFAWTMFLALLLRLGLPAMEVARFLGVACAAAAALVAARFAYSVEAKSARAAALTALLAAASSPFALWSTSGLETGFYTLVVTAALYFAFAPGGDPSRRSRNAALLFSLAALTRPDAPLFFVAWMGLRVLDLLRRATSPNGDDSPRRLARDLALFAAPLLPYAIWKLSYYGELVPNTYYAKSGLSTTILARGFDELKDYVAAYGWYLVAPALAVAAVGHRPHGARLTRLLAVLAAHALYVVVVGGDVLPLFRFWLPILPMGCALLVIGAGVVTTKLLRPTRVATVVSVCLPLAMALGGLFREWAPVRTQRGAMDDTTTKNIALWLGEHLRPDEPIAATPIGAVAYYSRRPVIDMLGLVDREIARHPEPIEGLKDTWKEKKYNAASVLRRRPGAILFSTGVRPSAAAEKALFLYEDFHASYYALYFRPDPRMPQPATIYRRRPDAPAPPDDLQPVLEHDFLRDYCGGLVLALREGKLREANRLFEQSVQESPPFFLDSLEWWATSLYDLDDPRAVPLLEEVLRLDPYAFLAGARLAHYHLQRNELDDAERIYRAMIERNPEDARSWAGLAEISRRRGNVGDAIEQIQKSLSFWSTNDNAMRLLAELSASAPSNTQQ